MAAALASASIVFKDNKVCSLELVHGAETLFNFSRRQRGRLVQVVAESANFYNASMYWDEFIWVLAKHAGAFWGAGDYGVLNWDSKLAGVQVHAYANLVILVVW